MDEAEAQAVASQVRDERPLGVGVAVSAHEGERRPEVLQPHDQMRRADIAQVPDFICTLGERLEIFGQMIVRIGEDEDAELFP